MTKYTEPVPTKCPNCGGTNIVFKQKAGVWECLACEDRFDWPTAKAAIRRLVDQAAHPKHIFFSYGHDVNCELVERFKADLEKRGHTVWFDVKDIGVWDDWKGSITRGIDRSQLAIAFMSKHALRDPGVCRNEIAIALNRFGTIYPVAVEPDIFDDTPLTIRHLQWPDLSQWRDIRGGKVLGEDWERWYEARLVELIEKVEGEASHYAGESQALREVLRPSSFDAKFAQHVPGFVGRDWVFEAYRQWLNHQPESRLFWIKAGPGVGKTALAVNLAARERGAIVASWFCDAKSPELRNPDQAIRTLAYQWALRWEDYRVRLLRELGITSLTAGSQLSEVRKNLNKQNDQDLFRNLLVEPLANLIWREHKLVVVLDALDEATDEAGNNPLTEFIANQLASLPDWIGFVVTSRPDPAVVNRLQGFKPFEIDAQGMQNLADLRRWYPGHLGCRSELANLPKDEQQRIEDLLIARSEGMILYLKLVDEGLREQSLAVSQLDQLESGLPGLFRRYYDSFNQRFGKNYEMEAKPLLRLLVAAGGPLPEDLAREVLGWNSEQFMKCRNSLGSYVTEYPAGYELFHKTLGEWLDDKAGGPFHLDKSVGRQQIADMLFKEITEKECHAVRWQTPIHDWLPGWMPQLDQHNDPASMRRLGTNFHAWGRYVDAHRFLEHALSINQREQGTSHPETASTSNYLARSLHALGDFKSALWYFNQSLAVRETVLGNEHPDTAESLNNLAWLLEEMGDFEAAKPLYERALSAREKMFGHEHATTATSLNNLAWLLQDMGEFSAARPLYERALRIREKTLGKNHPETAVSLNDLAWLLYHLAEHELARPLIDRALAIREEVLGPTHPGTATSLNIFALILSATGEIEVAVDTHKRALEIRRNSLGMGHPATATSLLNLGELLMMRRDYVSAESNFQHAYEIRSKLLGADHVDTLKSLSCLNTCRERRGNPGEGQMAMEN